MDGNVFVPTAGLAAIGEGAKFGTNFINLIENFHLYDSMLPATYISWAIHKIHSTWCSRPSNWWHQWNHSQCVRSIFYKWFLLFGVCKVSEAIPSVKDDLQNVIKLHQNIFEWNNSVFWVRCCLTHSNHISNMESPGVHESCTRRIWINWINGKFVNRKFSAKSDYEVRRGMASGVKSSSSWEIIRIWVSASCRMSCCTHLPIRFCWLSTFCHFFYFYLLLS